MNFRLLSLESFNDSINLIEHATALNMIRIEVFL